MEMFAVQSQLEAPNSSDLPHICNWLLETEVKRVFPENRLDIALEILLTLLLNFFLSQELFFTVVLLRKLPSLRKYVWLVYVEELPLFNVSFLRIKDYLTAMKLGQP